ncbi:hypothetical protein ACTWP5_19080 [Streptomyces sp. 4N509B]|uniref:hypothetical protein n=1 Tax=Streptomyces sp. 4N509B TaxID=3457413 RepID=UPI003FD2DB57
MEVTHVLSVSAVLLLGVVVVLLIRKQGLKALHAALCVLLGFYLASSSMAPSINDFGDTMAEVINNISDAAS